MSRKLTRLNCFICRLCFLCLSLCLARASDTLDWTSTDHISADIKSMELTTLLEKIAATTGWKIFVEPQTLHSVSAKFSNLPAGEALHLLLGDVNFALLPQTGARPRLLVFRTSMDGATQVIQPRSEKAAETHGKVIPNELIVRLKPGQKIEDLARQLGARVIGKIPGLNAYRLQFDSADSANAARTELGGNPQVASVDTNYQVDRPPDPGLIKNGPSGVPRLTLNPPSGDTRMIVGLVDTRVQEVSPQMDKFILKQLYAGDSQPFESATPLHGTAMAETILNSLGAAKGNNSDTAVQILPVDVYGSKPNTDTFTIGEGITQAVNGGAKIINMSFGSDADSPFLRDIITQGEEKSIIFVGAKGNTPDQTPFFPAAYSGVFAVTAMDNGVVAPYANRAAIPSLGAPGTAMVFYGNQSWYETGTSVSAAYMSGIVAGYLDNGSKSSDLHTYLFSHYGVGGK